MKRIVCLFFILSTALFAEAYDYHEEVLIGYLRNQEGMIFQVYSGGCTEKDDFRVSISRRYGKASLMLYRIRPDYCKGLMPFGHFVSFSYDELNLSRRQPIQILNPLNPGAIY